MIICISCLFERNGAQPLRFKQIYICGPWAGDRTNISDVVPINIII